jgi:hypothetical protein
MIFLLLHPLYESGNKQYSTFQVVDLWVVTPCSVAVGYEDGGSMVL